MLYCHPRQFPYYSLNRTNDRIGPYVSTLADIESALRNPTHGRPAYEASFPISNPRRAPRNPFMRPSFQEVSSHHTFVRGPDDPASLALEACGAERVSRNIFRMLVGEGAMETSLEASSSEVRQAPERPV